MWGVVQEVGHFGSLVPLALCLALAWKRDIPPDVWLVCLAFVVSFLADQAQAVLMAQHQNNWWVSYLYAPVQFGLWLALLAPSRAARAVAVGGLLVLAAGSVLRGPLTAPETVVQVAGGAMVGWLAWGSTKPCKTALMIYCWGAIPPLLLMAWWDVREPQWLWAWGAYQGIRVVAWGALLAGLWRAYGPDHAQAVSGGRGTPVRPLRRADPHTVEAPERSRVAI